MKCIAKYLQCPEGEATAGKLGTITVAEQAYDVAKKTKDNDLIHVKLFAVTQDVEVGDEVIDSKGNLATIDEIDGMVVTHTDKESGEQYCYTSKNKWTKVLGPLSPNATFVKEGEEIEGRLINTCECGDHEGVGCSCGKNDFKPVYQVLGPCGYYH